MKIYPKQFTGNLNSDAAPEVFPEGDKLEAVNLRIASTRDGSVGRLTNIKGNTLISNNLPPGINTVIGQAAHEGLGRIYFFVHNSNSNHQIWEYDSNTNSFVCLIEDSSSDTGGEEVLDFSLDHRINHINIISGGEKDDSGEPKKVFLFWVSGNSSPKYINTWRLKNNGYAIINRQVLSVIKYQPKLQIRAEYMCDPKTKSNSLWGRAWRFRYRYVYLDGETSSWSPISKCPVPTSSYPASVLTHHLDNVMKVNFHVDNDWIIDRIEMAVSYTLDSGNWSDWNVFKTLDPDGMGGLWNTVDFYGYEPLQVIPKEESDLLFDDVPIVAEAQEMVNGNVIVYGNQTRDYDLPEADTEIEYIHYDRQYDFQGGLAYIQTSMDYANRIFGYRIYIRHDDNYLGNIDESKRNIPYTVEVGDLSVASPTPLNYYKRYQYTPQTGDSCSDIASGLAIAMGGVPGQENGVSYIDVTLQDEIITRVCSGLVLITTPEYLDGSSKVWDHHYRGKLGIVYRDESGRVTSTIECVDVDIPSGSFMPNSTGATTRVYLKINHQPPDYAHTYQIVRSKNSLSSDFLEWVCGIDDINEDTGTVKLSLGFSSFNTSNPANKVDFIPTAGDIAIFVDKVFTPSAEQTVRNTNAYMVSSYNPEDDTLLVQGIDERLSENDPWLVRFYRPSDESVDYSEFGELYPVLDPGTPDRRHFGNISVQNPSTGRPAIVDLRGNAWMVCRRFYDNVLFQVMGVVQSSNLSDFFRSHIDDGGRPNVVDKSYRRRNYPVRISHGQPISTESDINELSRFYPADTMDVNLDDGPIRRLVSRDNYLICYQEQNSGAIPVGATVIQDNEGNEQLALSRQILNKIRPYAGKYGIGDKPSSFAKLDGYFYHISPDKGCLVRLAGDGMNPVSMQSGMDGYFKNILDRHRGKGDTIISFADQGNNEVIVHLKGVPGSNPETIAFSESSSGFPNTYSYTPDSGVSLASRLYTFKDGGMWLHESNPVRNNFYGEQHESRLTVIFNGDRAAIKSFLAVALQTNDLWRVESIETSLGQISNLTESDFIIEGDGVMSIDNKEGVFYADLLRDENSPGGIIEGDHLKGEWVKFTIVNNSDEPVYISAMYLKAIASKHGIS